MRCIRLLCVLLICGCESQSSLAPIVVGHVSSHESAGGGDQASLGIRLALEYVNRNTDAAPVAVRDTDAMGKLEAFAAQSVRLVTVNDAVAIIGGTDVKEVEQLDRGLVPLLALSGERSPTMSDLAFLTDLSAESRGAVAARFVVQELKAPYVLEIVDRRDDDANRISAAFTSCIARLYKRDEPLQHKTFLLASDADITRAAERVQKTKPDAVVFAGKLDTLAEIQRNLPQPVPVMLASRASKDAIDRFQGNLYTISAYGYEESVKSIKQFRDLLYKNFAREPDETSVLAYDAVLLLTNAARLTPHHNKPDKLAEELKKTKDLPGVTGPISFSRSTQLLRPAFVLRMGESVIKRYTAEETLIGKVPK